MTLRRVTMREVASRLGVTPRCIEKRVVAGRFPRPHYLGNWRRWWLHELMQWEQDNTRSESARKQAA